MTSSTFPQYKSPSSVCDTVSVYDRPPLIKPSHNPHRATTIKTASDNTTQRSRLSTLFQGHEAKVRQGHQMVPCMCRVGFDDLIKSGLHCRNSLITQHQFRLSRRRRQLTNQVWQRVLTWRTNREISVTFVDSNQSYNRNDDLNWTKSMQTFSL